MNKKNELKRKIRKERMRQKIRLKVPEIWCFHPDFLCSLFLIAIVH